MQSFNCISPTSRTQTRFQDIPHYAEGLYELGQNCYAWLVPNGSWGESSAGLIVGDGESLLVDTLWDVEFTQEMLTAMRQVTDEKEAPLKFTVNTHADGDHFWGNELVTDTQIITSQASFDEMKITLPKSMLLLNKIGKLFSTVGKFGVKSLADSGHWMQNMGKPYHFGGVTHTLPTQMFTGEMTLMVGGREVQFIEVGPMHTEGDLMVYVPDAKVLYSGDVLFITSTPVMWAGPLSNWIKALDQILALDVEIIVPGHGPIVDKEGVRQVKAYWEYMDAAIQTGFSAGKSAVQTATDIALSADFAQQFFATWDSPERIMTSTHTQYRHLQGNPKSPSKMQLINILRHQAILAHKLPDASPQVMRRK